ncbi:hypothetical protein MTR67_026065 [Solanum verrucosum]|uniref:Uncharacterized protein n=1 Tax=Solanum verrucosum TaxID=315347 RepID=A0AAF0TZ22_SOLVR|nr:hypothetical protein MTR67_026065 [Solanum verrucosum]
MFLKGRYCNTRKLELNVRVRAVNLISRSLNEGFQGRTSRYDSPRTNQGSLRKTLGLPKKVSQNSPPTKGDPRPVWGPTPHGLRSQKMGCIQPPTDYQLSPWVHPRPVGMVSLFDTFEVRPWGIDLLRKSLEKVKFIQEKLLVAQSRQKKYEDRKVKDLGFMEEKFFRGAPGDSCVYAEEISW